MTADDHAALRALGIKMASKNGYAPKQSSSLYVTDGDEIDYAYGRHRIFMYTFELYPSHAKVSSTARFYPPDEQIGPQTERNKDAILLPDGVGRAACTRSSARRTTHCGAVQRGLRDLARLEGRPARHRHGQRRRLAAGRSFDDHVPGRHRSGRGRRRWSRVRRPGRPRTRTTSTAGRPRSARPRSSCPRPSAT